jgi:hypothetical protein
MNARITIINKLMIMKKNRFLVVPLVVLFTLGVSSCELLEGDGELTQSEIVSGLKKALELGTDSATNFLGLADGYYKGDVLNVKIPLPAEAEAIRKILVSNATVAKYFNLDTQFENVVKSLNRAAEEAAKEASPIFKNAITSMSISDGWEILNGKNPLMTEKSGSSFDSTAATGYFKVQTLAPLTDLYSPKINHVLNQNLGLGFSANQAWKTLEDAYNGTINSSSIIQISANLAGLPSQLSTDLGVFATGKALDGLFYMVGKEEKKIRKDPFQWAIDIIQRVFGSVKV